MIFRDAKGKPISVRYVSATPAEARALACAFTESSQSVPYKPVMVGSVVVSLVRDPAAPAQPEHVAIDETTATPVALPVPIPKAPTKLEVFDKILGARAMKWERAR